MVKLKYEGECFGCPYVELELIKHADGDPDVEERFYDIRCIHENPCMRLWQRARLQKQNATEN